MRRLKNTLQRITSRSRSAGLLIVILSFFGFSFIHSAPVTYGSTIKLLFPSIANAALHSHGIQYWHQGTSGQQQVTGDERNDSGDLWVVKGPHGSEDSFQAGQQIQSGARIRLAFPQTNGILHNHERSDMFPSPLPGTLEVTALNGKNSGDDWIVTTLDGQPWTDASQVTIKPATVLNNYYLTAVTQTFNVREKIGGTDEQKIVLLGKNSVDWKASIVTPVAASTQTATSIVSAIESVATGIYSAVLGTKVPLNAGLKFGDTIRLRHRVTSRELAATDSNYSTGSKQKAIGAANMASFPSDDQKEMFLWKVEAAHGKATQVGQFVKSGDSIRLRSLKYSYCLHSHDGSGKNFPENLRSPSTQQGEVTGFGMPGGVDAQGDGNDDWIIRADVVNGGLFKLEHASTARYLHSHSGHFIWPGNDFYQEVTTYWDRDENDDWTLIIVNQAQLPAVQAPVVPQPITTVQTVPTPIVPTRPVVAVQAITKTEIDAARKKIAELEAALQQADKDRLELIAVHSKKIAELEAALKKVKDDQKVVSPVSVAKPVNPVIMNTAPVAPSTVTVVTPPPVKQAVQAPAVTVPAPQQAVVKPQAKQAKQAVTKKPAKSEKSMKDKKTPKGKKSARAQKRKMPKRAKRVNQRKNQKTNKLDKNNVQLSQAPNAQPSQIPVDTNQEVVSDETSVEDTDDVDSVV